MKILAVISLILSIVGILLAVPFILLWWDFINSFSSDPAIAGFMFGLLFEVLALALAIICLIISVTKKIRNPAYLIPKFLFGLMFGANILVFGVFILTIFKLIIISGSVMH